MNNDDEKRESEQAGPMKFFTVNREWFRPIKEASNHDAGVLLKFMVLCAEERNGGLVDVDAWTRRQWSLRVGMPQKPAENPAFFRRENGLLRVLPHDVEREAQSLRTSEKQANRAQTGWETRRKREADAAACAVAMQNKDKDTEIEGEEDGEEENSFPAPPRPTAATSPRTPTNSALGKLTARETQPADQDDQAEPLEQGARKQPTYEDVLECVTWRFQSLGINDGKAIEAAAREYWRERQAHGWIGENGEPIQNWMNHARLFVEERTKAVRADAGNAPTLADVQEVIGGEIANHDECTKCAKAFLAGWNAAGNHGGREWQPEAISYAKGWIEPPPGDDEDEQGEDEPDFSDYRD